MRLLFGEVVNFIRILFLSKRTYKVRTEITSSIKYSSVFIDLAYDLSRLWPCIEWSFLIIIMNYYSHSIHKFGFWFLFPLFFADNRIMLILSLHVCWELTIHQLMFVSVSKAQKYQCCRSRQHVVTNFVCTVN